MQAVADVAARPVLGPLPTTPAIGRAITDLNPGLFRSAFTGQANAVLLRPALRILGRRVEVLNPRRFRDAQARWLRLDWIARLAWGKERRIVQAVHVQLPDGRHAWIGNLHATSYPPDQRLPDAELLRAATFVDGLAAPDELVVLAGDFNVAFLRSRTLHDLTGAEWGFSNAGPGIDHVLVRGAALDAGAPLARRAARGPRQTPLRPLPRGGDHRVTVDAEVQEGRARFPAARPGRLPERGHVRPPRAGDDRRGRGAAAGRRSSAAARACRGSRRWSPRATGCACGSRSWSGRSRSRSRSRARPRTGSTSSSAASASARATRS